MAKSPVPPIRPAVQKLIDRGHVQLDEIYPFDPPCTPAESQALIPALTNVALAQRTNRCSASTPNWQPGMPGFTLRELVAEAVRRIQWEPPQSTMTNRQLRAAIDAALAAYPKPTGNVARTYVEGLYFLAVEVRKRLHWHCIHGEVSVEFEESSRKVLKRGAFGPSLEPPAITEPRPLTEAEAERTGGDTPEAPAAPKPEGGNA